MSLTPAALFLLAASQSANPAPAVWLEGESAQTGAPFQKSGWGLVDQLSGRQWLSAAVDGGEVEAKTPAEGLSFALTVPPSGSGRREVWARIGYEQARSPFSWRVKGGDWKRVEPSARTTDLAFLAEWTEAAWLKLGDAVIPATGAEIEFQIPRSKNSQGQWDRLLFALDAVCLSAGPFQPNGPSRPGEVRGHPDDAKAASQVFEAPAPGGSSRASVSLEGLWEVARWDEDLPGPVAAPMPPPPGEGLFFTGIAVPSDRNVSRPDLTFAHRLWYRTRIRVPEDHAPRGYLLDFPLNSLNTTVYVNGKLCGFNRNPFVPWKADISSAVKPGVNEIWVGIRDAWYGFSASPTNPMKLRRMFNYPPGWANRGFMDLAYPLWNAFQSGILETPSLIVAPSPTLVEDAFVKTSVSAKRLDAELTVKGGKASGARVRIKLEAFREGQQSAAWSHDAGLLDLGDKEDAVVTVGAPWANPELWWPDRPVMHRLVTSLYSEKGILLDRHEQPFGFREWGQRGKDFTLNGVIWRGWAELTGGATPEEFLKRYRETDQRFMRLAGVSQGGGYKWKGLSWREALSFFDRSGVVVRRSGLLDGQMIGHMAIENDPELKSRYGSEIKMELMENWLPQMAAQARGERNHPSIHIWSLENEWLYINCINLYGGLMDEFEREVFRVSDAVRAMDPTRPTMVDGGGAGKAQGLPVHGDHYVYTNDPRSYPQLAYEAFPTGGGRGRWVWDQQRPRYLGEDFFASGINPSDYAWIQGESAFQGKAAAEKGYALVQRMLTEGYRWGQHYGAWHFWVGEEGGQFGKHLANKPLAAFFREQDWTFAPGQKVSRTLGVFNDSFGDEKIKVEAGFAGQLQSFEVALTPGSKNVRGLEFVAPPSPTRREIDLLVVLTVGGKEVFRDVKKASILPAPAKLALEGAAVYDPKGALKGALELLGVKALPVSSLNAIPAGVRLLIVGPNALSRQEAQSSLLSAWASSGRRVVVLEQENPLQGQGLPAAMDPEPQQGSFAFLEDPTHPLLAGLEDKDFFTWPGGLVYRSAYGKPSRGARSLIQAGSQLKLSLLSEVPVGEGVLLLCQTRVGEIFSSSTVAQRLVRNMLSYASSYKLQKRTVFASLGADPLLVKVLNEIGVKKTLVKSPLEAISQPGSIALVTGTTEHLKALASAPAALKKFFDGGGRLLIQGLDPAALADYNRVAGMDHIARPFRREKVALSVPRDPLASGISLGDVALLSSEKMFAWNDDKWVSSTTFGTVLDLEDVAPFAELPHPDLYNTVNGMVSADAWPYIYSFGLDSQKPEYEMTFPKPQTFTEMEWTGNGFYHLVTKFELIFDGGAKREFTVQPGTMAQTLAIQPPATASKVLLRITDWQRVPTATQNVVGIDNIRLFAQRPPGFRDRVKPLLNIGALLRYPKGAGTMVYSGLRFMESEDVPSNGLRKRSVLAALLRNLEAEFAGGAAVIAGEALDYQPLDLSRSANQYRTERGWFGDPALSFKDLPGGRQVLGGVPYQVYDFATSPVPTIVMLGGEGIPNGLAQSVTIPVGAKADALFFLMAARVDQPLSDQERREGRRPVMAELEVAFADGTKESAPLVLGEDLDDYRQESPRSLKGAQIAWTRPWAGTSLTAVAYSKQWSNPTPEKAVASVTLRFGPDRRGTPAILAVTAARRPGR